MNEFCPSKDYGPALSEIGIIPIILRQPWALKRKERRLFQRKQCRADYRLKIDFDAFMAGDSRDRELLLVRNILTAVNDLTRKAGNHFRGAELRRDIIALFDSETDSVLE